MIVFILDCFLELFENICANTMLLNVASLWTSPYSNIYKYITAYISCYNILDKYLT